MKFVSKSKQESPRRANRVGGSQKLSDNRSILENLSVVPKSIALRKNSDLNSSFSKPSPSMSKRYNCFTRGSVRSDRRELYNQRGQKDRDMEGIKPLQLFLVKKLNSVKKAKTELDQAIKRINRYFEDYQSTPEELAQAVISYHKVDLI